MTEEKLKEVKRFVKKAAINIEDPQHGWEHVSRVAGNARKIVETLIVEDKIDLNLLLVTCYLHDINHTQYSPSLFNYLFETKRSKLVLPKVLKELDIEKNERGIIENAVYSSSFSFPLKRLNREGDIYAQLLQDADTLDFFSKEREESFNMARKKYLFYKILGLFSDYALKYGRDNLENYLNFPQIAKESYVRKS